MATGSGFTTLCEVVVTPADSTKFEIVPYDRAEVELTIDDFCRSIWSRVFPRTEDSDGAGEAQVSFPVELVRAVRNMVRLPEGDRKEDDAAVRMAQQFGKTGTRAPRCPSAEPRVITSLRSRSKARIHPA